MATECGGANKGGAFERRWGANVANIYVLAALLGDSWKCVSRHLYQACRVYPVSVSEFNLLPLLSFVGFQSEPTGGLMKVDLETS